MLVFSHFQLFVGPWTVACRLLCPWDSPGKYTGVGCHALLPDSGIEPTSLMSPALAGGFFNTSTTLEARSTTTSLRMSGLGQVVISYHC